jgi:ribonuclease G
MSKELIVSSSSHETKIAILEDDQLTEVYFEREQEYTLAGSIYKGRVTRVLPGMQSAFVDIGLERDAFLYVSDFLEDTEEYDRIASTVEAKVIQQLEQNVPGTAASAAVPPSVAEVESEPAPVQPSPERQMREPVPAAQPSRPPQESGNAGEQRFTRRSRRRRGGHQRGFPESKYASRGPQPPTAPPTVREEAPSDPVEPPIILPGESLAKYRGFAETNAADPEPGIQSSTEPAEESFGYEEPGPASLADSGSDLPMNRPGTAYEKQPAAANTDDEASGRAGSARLNERPSNASAEEITPAKTLAQQVEENPQAWDMLSRQAAQAEEQAELRASEHPAAESTGSAMSKTIEQPPIASSISEPAKATTSETEGSLASEAIASHEVQRILSEQLEPEQPDASDSGSGDFEPGSDLQALEAHDDAQDEATGETGEINEPSADAQADTGAPNQQASVRERYRNPRYQRKGGRWGRRGGRPPQTGPRPAGAGPRPPERERTQPLIADLLKEGQEILVQIAKEPLGKKGARITSHIALPGRYLVYMPTVDHVGVSRKIASDEERQRLKRIILEHSKGIPGGFIVRTAGEGHSEEDLRQDIQYLSRLSAEIRSNAEKSSAPVLLHHDLNLVLRILRDQLSQEFAAVWVDSEQEYERIVSLVSKFQPALVNRVKLYTKDIPIFDEMGIQEEINKALKPKVWLKSGGYIVINQTEALVAIDVNTGKFVGKSNRLEDTIVKTNVEAIKEIVRQIRLRDLGGIIVVDFIDMDEKKNRQKVMSAMEDALRSDRAPSKILAFNEFGLVAITRKRVRQSLERTLCQPCAYCGGSGLVKSITSICYEILSEAKKIVKEIERKQITLRVNPEIGRALKTKDNTILSEIEELTGRPVVIRNDPTLHVEHFDFN